MEALPTQFKLPEAEATEWNRQLLWQGMIDVALRLTITQFDPARLASSDGLSRRAVLTGGIQGDEGCVGSEGRFQHRRLQWN
jgi:hypothetical protein